MRILSLVFLVPALYAQPAITWTEVKQANLEGQGWTETKHPFDRFPAKAEGVVRGAVWNLSRNSAGMRVRFATDATAVHAKWALRGANLAMPHMPATGVSGLDLYVRHEKQWRWLANGRPTEKSNTQALVQNWSGGRREYLLYLPLYNSIDTLSIGVPEDAKFEFLPREAAKPILFYGSSILQGGCASRPGMVYTSIIGRMLDYPTANFGFSGNGVSEPEIAELFAELDPAVYVYDSLPNMSLAQVQERTEPFLGTLRKAHPKTPIVIVENTYPTNSAVVPSRARGAREKNEAMKAIFEKLKAAGDRNLYYVVSDNLLGTDGEGTVDGVHPTDLGFVRMAEGIAPVIRPLIPGK